MRYHWLILVACLLFVLGCTQETKRGIASSQECQTKAKNLIPPVFTLFEMQDGDWGLMLPKWNDGLEPTTLNFDGFSKGYLPGENTNYYYTRLKDESKPGGIVYNKQIVSPEGEILRYDYFVVNIVLQPILTSQYKDKLFESTVMNFTILNSEIIECNGFDG